jgi:type I restriction enzyme S subunit
MTTSNNDKKALNVPPLRFPEFKGEWEKAPLSSFGVLERGRSRHRPRNDARLFGNEVPFVQTGDVHNSGLYITNYEARLSPFGVSQSKIWPSGTLCITIAANIADCALLSQDACFPDSIIGFQSNGKTSNAFIKYVIDSTHQKLDRLSTPGAQKNLNQKTLGSTNIFVPKAEEQEKIVSFLSFVDREIMVQRKIIEDIALQKKSIRGKCFNLENGPFANQKWVSEPISSFLEE